MTRKKKPRAKPAPAAMSLPSMLAAHVDKALLKQVAEAIAVDALGRVDPKTGLAPPPSLVLESRRYLASAVSEYAVSPEKVAALAALPTDKRVEALTGALLARAAGGDSAATLEALAGMKLGAEVLDRSGPGDGDPAGIKLSISVVESRLSPKPPDEDDHV